MPLFDRIARAARTPSPPWDDPTPVRRELFGAERLEQHATSLATAQPVTARPPARPSLRNRLDDDAAVLFAAYRSSAEEVAGGHDVAPAAEWFLDNYHVIEAQVREVRDALPPNYYRQLPKLAEGPFEGYPRVLGLAWAYVSHTDSHVDPELLRRFIAAYQRVQPLTVGELWAVPITLRFVLLENLRRLVDEIGNDRRAFEAAQSVAERIHAAGASCSWRASDLDAAGPAAWTAVFAAQLAKRLRDQDPVTTPALGWLEEHLAQRGTSIDDVVRRAQQRVGACNVSVRNAITSMRIMSGLDWAELFESVSLVDARLRNGSAFGAMDFPTRDSYRAAIEELARGSSATELEVTDQALASAAAATRQAPLDDAQAERVADPGFHLIGPGRRALERTLGARPPLRKRVRRAIVGAGLAGSLGAIAGVTLLLLTIVAWALASAGLAAGWIALVALLVVIPMSEVGTALVHRLITRRLGTEPLSGLALEGGVPSSLRTLVVVPTLLGSETDMRDQVERLEVHHLAGASGDLTFALLPDGIDAAQPHRDGDERVLAVAQNAIDALNERHGPGPAGPRFLLLHRRRVFGAGEGMWMGWERKRGKLRELNRLLRGATDTTFQSVAGRPVQVPADVRYVITLDADTRLPRDAALRLIGKMAHPLNRPILDASGRRVVSGYAVLQPRVTASFAFGGERSIFQRVFGVLGGLDPYAAAVSDVYQDLFGEGSFTGKGIYDVDAFEAVLGERIPDGSVLSHDLFEGVFARAGLASDVEVVEASPSRFDVAATRQHRWTRGDWQLLPWVFGSWSGPGAVPTLGRWKMIDNLRRSTVPPFALLSLVACWLLPAPANAVGVAFVLASLAIPAFLPAFYAVMPRRSGVLFRNHLTTLLGDTWRSLMQAALTLAFLGDSAYRMVDAITRTIVRVLFTRRHLLEWTTAARATPRPRLGVLGFYRQMSAGTLLSLGVTAGAIALRPAAWALVLPFGLLWLAAPALAAWISRSPVSSHRRSLSVADDDALRRTARRTWRYFETFVTPADHMLPPDNFQEDPVGVVARRTSPTNIGLYLLSAVAARDFGWAGTVETVARLEATFAQLERLERFRGHFFNWYGTHDAQVLEPAYVSSVDSGNLAGHLIALANACEQWVGAPEALDARRGVLDVARLAREALDALPGVPRDPARRLASVLETIAAALSAPLPEGAGSPRSEGAGRALPEGVGSDDLELRARDAARLAADLAADVETAGAGDDDLTIWTAALGRTLAAHAQDRSLDAAAREDLDGRLRALAATARAMALAMDFSFLVDPERGLLSIGYSLSEHGLDRSCYDLLASEARLASLFAIAKGDVATRHWFRLGREARPAGSGSVLWSWSGSMFEYLMPSLVMHAPVGSLLEQSQRRAVERQQAYGRSLDLPWGVSESAYAARDLALTYQYAAFGVPDLGLRRGLAESVVVAPYATGLAAMVDPRAARRNFERLKAFGALGRYGFVDALDFTPARVPTAETVVLVRTYMAHHQGMTVVAIANALDGGRMREHFHREPIVQATELLLEERIPHDVVAASPRADRVLASPAEARALTSTARHLTPPMADAPTTHLLSNGRYAVMLTATGAGYSRWRDVALTRWREDASRDELGSFVFLRDIGSGAIWSAGLEPLGGAAADDVVVFGEDHAEFTRRDGAVTTTTDVLVSAEADAEVRRVSVANAARRARVIEITSYAELVLTSPVADAAHPAFAKMFVQTEFLPEYGALVATRRRRSPDEPEVWAAHLAVVEGELVAEAQHETDRARFLGRGNAIGAANAIHAGGALSNTVGTVLDPIFALRRRVRVPAGGIARVAFWTVVASSRAEVLDLVDQHLDRSAFERAKTLAWTQAQVQLRFLDVSSDEAADFQRLATPLIVLEPRFRAPPTAIAHGAGPQSGLWPYAVSGDLPIVLLRIRDLADIGQVRQLLRAHEYWRLKRLAVDLVVLNEREASYQHDLQVAIETAVRSSQSRPRLGDVPAQGSVHVLRADQVSVEARALLRSVARVSLVAERGPIAHQLACLPPFPPPAPATLSSPTPVPARRRRRFARAPTGSPGPSPSTPPDTRSLEFFNGLGGFGADGREYVVILSAGQTTPAPWINVVANAAFGFLVSAEGSGATWSENSRDHQLTPWSNDPVAAPAGEALFVRDEVSGDVWTATAEPIRDAGTYVARHGFGYSRFEHEADGVAMRLLQFVPLDDPIKVSRLTLHNRSGVRRRLSVTAYAEWVLGTSRAASAPHLTTEIDPTTGAMLVRNPWASEFAGRVAFADVGERPASWTGDRTEFLGRGGRLAAPAALGRSAPLSGRSGAGLDPCTALQRTFEVAPGASIEFVSLLGACASAEEAVGLVTRYRAADLDAVLREVETHWAGVLGAVQVATPERAMDVMLNGWLLYQTIACRTLARSGFYQASGAYGFRDQLQDGMALTFAQPEETRRHLLRAASRQFVEGDVQHWWLPQTGRGVRTRISDDRVWLAFAAATYVASAGDAAVLEEVVPFIEGPALRPGQHDAFFEPIASYESGSLFEHCARGLDQAVALTGERGLPLMGTGDWNDGMNRVGAGGRGESVWLGWLLLRTIELFAPLADERDPPRARRWRAHAEDVRASLEREAWDGAWYRRATFDDGTWLGSADGEACRIDSVPQSWAVLSGAADPARSRLAMASVRKHLVRPDDGLVLLFTPPFDRGPLDPGYIKGYPPGLRENGGQYSHAAMWAILAFTKLGDGDEAVALFELLNPIQHARTPDAVERYKVEPYVVAADVYALAPHVGRGGWTWYTGSAAWMYRAGVEGILGLRREGDTLVVEPCIPTTWPGFEASVRVGSSRYDIQVENDVGRTRPAWQVVVDGVSLSDAERTVRVALDGGTHRLVLSARPADVSDAAAAG